MIQGFDLAGFAGLPGYIPEGKYLEAQEELQTLKSRTEDQKDVIEYQNEVIERLEAKLDILKLHKPTITERKIYKIKEKILSMPYREGMVVKQNGFQYMTSSEIVDYLTNEIDIELRFNEELKNPNDLVKKYIQTICDTWKGEFKTCKIGGKKPLLGIQSL
jgi:hypothetical protein